MLKFILLFTAWAIAIVSEGSTIMDPKRLVKRGVRARYCGSQLVDALSLVCGSAGYYDPYTNNSVGRRHLVPSMIDPYQNWFAIHLSSRDQNEAEFQTSLDQLPTSPLYKRLQPRGIIDECCRSPCSIYSLQSYCNNE
ncbi:unnamed protein product [Larinioides sclopetarius]|uniref:Insulin-like domain-containing protein n=1 Tax=Larinioides sclopetarius TaxID=280406 RepID=A0AAV2BHS9_9ARAC